MNIFFFFFNMNGNEPILTFVHAGVGVSIGDLGLVSFVCLLFL